MKGKSRRDKVNDIEAIDEQGKVQIWQLFRSEAGLWKLRDAQGIEIEALTQNILNSPPERDHDY